MGEMTPSRKKRKEKTWTVAEAERRHHWELNTNSRDILKDALVHTTAFLVMKDHTNPRFTKRGHD